MIYRLIVRINNWLTRARRVRVLPENLLLLIPHCLHRDSCPRNVLHNLDECRRCGQCRVADLLRARDDYGLICCVAGGGRQALLHTGRKEVKAVVAVACERELVQGILACFPKPVLAVANAAPEGPCRNTTVDMDRVLAAIDSVVARATPGSARR